MGSLRIAYVVLRFPSPSEQFVLREIEGLMRLGLEVQVVVIGSPDRSTDAPDTSPLPLVRRPPSWHPQIWWFAFTTLVKRPGKIIQVLRLARKICAKEHKSQILRALHLTTLALFFAGRLRRSRVDLLHAHFTNLPASLACLLSILLDRPWGFSAHARDIFAEEPDLLTKIDRAHHVITCSETSARWIKSQVSPELHRRIHCIHHGLDLEQWRRKTPPQRTHQNRDAPPLILAVGRLEPKKGFSILIHALERLRRDGLDVRGRIIGAGREESNLRELIDRLQLSQTVELRPWVPPHALRIHYEEANLLVVPSVIAKDGDRDNIPNVLVEALSLELPVVASSLPSIRRLLAPSRAGLLFPAGDPPQLARRIDQLLAHPTLASELSQAGRKLVESKFDLHVASSKIKDVFTEP